MKLGFVGRFLDTFFSIPVLFALLAMLGMQYFFPGNGKKTVVIPVLNREIHFVDHKVKHDRELVCVETDLCEYSFSTLGAVLVGSSFKNYLGQDRTALRTIHERGQFERDQGVFLLALENSTPLDYALEEQKTTENGVEVRFAAETIDKQWKIGKTFRVYNDSYRIDIALSFTPLKTDVEPLVSRLFVPGPYLGEVEKDKLEGVVQPLGDGSVERVSGEKEGAERWWNAPAVAGVEDKYFLHALIGYEAGFLKHVFFKRTASAAGNVVDTTSPKRPAVTATGLAVVFECVPVTEQSEVSLNWYVGPKSLHAMEKVDERLSAFLSLGWFSFFGRWLLSLLESLFMYLGNYGWAIIALTLIIRIPLIPFFIYCKRKAAAYESVTRRYSHELAAINTRYKDDAIARQDAVSQFYLDHGATSAGGVYALLPQLLMLPVFVSLYGLLNNAIALYHAPFFGWITNLSATDPYYILPALMAGGIVFQQYLSPTGGREMYVLKIVMPILMFAFMTRFPVGILLYLVVNAGVAVVEDIIRIRYWRA